jgi:DNA primase
MVSAITSRIPAATGFITATPEGGGEPENLARFLSEELAIGDLEEEIEALQAQLNDPSLSADDADLIFNMTVSLQGELKAMRASHIPL